MPLPLIVVLAGYVITAYETYAIGKEVYEHIATGKKDLEKAKKDVAKMMDSIKKQIGENIDVKEEVGFLKLLTKDDPQSEITKNATGRGSKNSTIEGIIKQKIPFRQVISMVCSHANAMPVLQLRNKKDSPAHAKIPASKSKALIELLKLTAEELADVNIDDYILCRLKQLAANLIFEFMDELLNWKSPLKPEVTYYPNGKGGFEDPVFDAQPTKLKRAGKKINPFHPPPKKKKGMIAADVIITEYRAKPATLDNIFALIEIKFPKDNIDPEQFKNYARLNQHSGLVKTGLSKTDGFRLSLFRYPEDKAVFNEDKNSSHSSRSRTSPTKQK